MGFKRGGGGYFCLFQWVEYSLSINKADVRFYRWTSKYIIRRAHQLVFYSEIGLEPNLACSLVRNGRKVRGCNALALYEGRFASRLVRSSEVCLDMRIQPSALDDIHTIILINILFSGAAT